jgi:hypothetical protein
MGASTPPVFGGGMPTGYSDLTPDQAAMLQQQGYFMRPDAVMPTGSPGWQQPAGYSNLTPDQIQAVNQQGYYTQPGVQQPSLWSQIQSKLGASIDPLQKAQQALAANNGPRPSIAPPQYPSPMPSQYGNPYNIYRRSQLDPKHALAALLAGTG